MSKIWNALRDLERLKNRPVSTQSSSDPSLLDPDRRSTKRFFANAPVSVYGYAVTDDPFLEQAEALSVNAGGGIITLNAPVNPGQTLLLINERNLKEQQCTVLRHVFTGRQRTGIIVKFSQPVPDFWDSPHL
jgi:hypothetical protein